MRAFNFIVYRLSACRKSTKIKRLRLSRETIIQLDALIAARRIKIHAQLRARVFYVWCVWNPFSGFDDIILLYVPWKMGEKFLEKERKKTTPCSKCVIKYIHLAECLNKKYIVPLQRWFPPVPDASQTGGFSFVSTFAFQKWRNGTTFLWDVQGDV